MSAQRSSDLDYVARLGAVLLTRDARQLRDFLAGQARQFGDQDQVAQVMDQSNADLETLMHRMTLARSDMSGYHAASRKWLRQRGVEAPPIAPSRQN